MSYCIGVNRVGLDANNYEYSGHSAVYDALGKKLSNIQPSNEDIEVIVLNKKHIDDVRSKLRFLDDKDSFSLE
jgi:predicted amidohydrolase